MSGDQASRRLETSHLVVGYALSRLDTRLLQTLGFSTWNEAYDHIGKLLSAAPMSIKNLRDEFDPLHPNPRKGWWDRPMLPSRVKVVDELHAVSDEALVELVLRLLQRQDSEAEEVLDALSQPSRVVEAAAERMLTGRMAEEFVWDNSEQVLQLPKDRLRDCRDKMLGFDFEGPGIAIEVKGLRGVSGEILFTDREWSVARERRESYWLAVVGNVRQSEKLARVVKDPFLALEPACVYERSVRAVWKSRFDVAA